MGIYTEKWESLREKVNLLYDLESGLYKAVSFGYAELKNNFTIVFSSFEIPCISMGEVKHGLNLDSQDVYTIYFDEMRFCEKDYEKVMGIIDHKLDYAKGELENDK